MKSKSARLSFLIVSLMTTNAFAQIESYRATAEFCHSEQGPRIVIRRFQFNSRAKVLAVDPLTLKTELLAAEVVNQCAPAGEDLNLTNYGKLLKSARENETARSNAGVTHSPNSTSLFLTVDLCPSSHAFEKEFFEWIGDHRVPVAISISGGWMKRHADELTVLKSLPTNIVWVNHTLTHPYVRSLPDEHNFLLLPHVDLVSEVFGNEQLMIENGLTPSIFLRFPGLVSDRAIADQVNSWGLVALGADAWLALGQNARPGSIILVHGNGNEAPGIHRFMARAEQFLRMGFQSLVNFTRD